jgi:DNA mismatch repair ATPase MutS
VALFLSHTFLREDLRLLLRRGAGDVSRGLQRISTGRNDEQDLLEVRDFIVMCERVVELLRQEADGGAGAEDGWAPLRTMISRFRSLSALGTRLVEAMDEAVVERRMRSQEALARETEEEVLGDLARDTVGEDAPPKSRKRAGKDAVVERPTHWGAPFEHLIRPG